MRVDKQDYNYNRRINDQEFNYKFKIIARFNESLTQCPVCGSEECCGAKEKFIWAEFGEEKLAIHFEDGEFERYLDYWYYDGMNESKYKLLPKFIRDFNEGTGWDNTYGLNPNSVIDAIDFRNAMEIIKNSVNITVDDKFLTLFYPVIIEFIDKVIAENKILNIIK